jgi:hypothetical protein
MTTEPELTTVDRDALERSLVAVCRRSPEDAARFEAMLDTKGWLEACETAAYSMQCRTLALKCWQAPPMHSGDVDYGPTATYGNKTSEVRLKRRLLALNLSIFEPDPAAAIAKAERDRRAARRNGRAAA